MKSLGWQRQWSVRRKSHRNKSAVHVDSRAKSFTSRLGLRVLTQRNAIFSVVFLANFKADMGLETPLDHPSSQCLQTGVSMFVYSTKLSVFKTTHQTVDVLACLLFYAWTAV